MVKHVERVNGPQAVVFKWQLFGLQDQIDKWQNLDIAGNNVCINLANDSRAAADFQPATRTVLKIAQVHCPALAIKFFKQLAQDTLSQHHLAVRNRKGETIHVVWSNRGVDEPVSDCTNHRALSGTLRPGKTLDHSCSNHM